MISIVVPVYNVEKYLERCVDSLINQTYENIEILLIDDGSKDNSGQMCDEYANKDSRITVYHKENGGLSDARNYGMDRAKGEYIIFIDSDDYVEPDMMEFLIGSIGDCDMATCGVFDDYASERIVGYLGEELSFETDNIEAFRLILIGDVVKVSVCCKLIKTEIARKQRFPVGRLYEDAFFNNDLMLNVKRVKINTRPFYHYVHRQGSITTTPFKDKDMDVVFAYQEAKRRFGEYSQIKNEVELRLYWAYFVILDRILLLEEYNCVPEYTEVVRYLKKNWTGILKTKYFTLKRKIAVIALKLNVKLYRYLVVVNKNNSLYD